MIKIWLILLTLVITSCSTMSASEKDVKRSELDAMADKAVADLIDQDASLQKDIDESIGYAVGNAKLTKVPLVGGGGGEGVLVNKKTDKRTYFTVNRFDVGGGVGARSFKILLVFDSADVLGKFEDGTREFQAGAEVSAGSAAAEGSAAPEDQGYKMHVLSDGGASATVTARVINFKVNTDLTE